MTTTEITDSSDTTGSAEDPISPELVLIDPELAQRARLLLPDFPGPSVAPLAGGAAEGAKVLGLQDTHRASAAAALPVGQRRGRRRLLVVAACLLALLVVGALAATGRLSHPPGPTLAPQRPQSTAETSAPGRTGTLAAATPAPARLPRGSPAPNGAKTAHKGETASTARRLRGGRTRSPGRGREPRGDVGARLPPVDRFALPTFASIGFARAAFGKPTIRRRTRDYCRVNWRTQGLTIIVNRVGSGDPCGSGRPVGAIVVGRQWRTSAGMRIGDSVRVLKQKYPYSSRHARGWWWLVVTRRKILGQEHPEPTLVAHVSSGRVDSLVVG